MFQMEIVVILLAFVLAFCFVYEVQYITDFASLPIAVGIFYSKNLQLQKFIHHLLKILGMF